MQRASDVVAVLAILVGSAGSVALSTLAMGTGASKEIVEVRVRNAPSNPGRVLAFPLPSVGEREFHIQSGELRVMHVPLVPRGGEAVGTSGGIQVPVERLDGRVLVEFLGAVAPGLSVDPNARTAEKKRHERHKRKRQKRRRSSGH